MNTGGRSPGSLANVIVAAVPPELQTVLSAPENATTTGGVVYSAALDYVGWRPTACAFGGPDAWIIIYSPSFIFPRARHRPNVSAGGGGEGTTQGARGEEGTKGTRYFFSVIQPENLSEKRYKISPQPFYSTRRIGGGAFLGYSNTTLRPPRHCDG